MLKIELNNNKLVKIHKFYQVLKNILFKKKTDLKINEFFYKSVKNRHNCQTVKSSSSYEICISLEKKKTRV